MLVNPSEKQTEKEKWVEQSLIRSHASARAHRSKRHQAERVKRLQEIEKLSTSLDLQTSELPGHTSSKKRRSKSVAHQRRLSWNGTVTGGFTMLPIQIEPSAHFEEGRSLQFFRERTAAEWSVWYDIGFWQVLALQAATSNSSVKHALTSLGAYHESLGMYNSDEKKRFRLFSMAQCQKALTSLIRDYNQMSVSAILTTYAAIATVAAFTNGSFYLQAVQTQFDILDNLRERPDQTTLSDRMYISQYLEPSIERQRSETGQYVDLLWCLRATPAAFFDEPLPTDIPKQFSSLNEAQTYLDKVLNSATYKVKTGHQIPGQIPEAAENCFNLWLEALNRFELSQYPNPTKYSASCSHHHVNSTEIEACATRRGTLTISLMKISGKLSMLMISTMDVDSENVFDDYLPLYQELANIFTAVLELQEMHSAPSCFHLASSLLRLVGNAASRWCRDPTTRRRLISLLYRAQSPDVPEGAVVWAEYCRCTMQLEEQGLPTPPTCAADIPVENRVRIHLASFYHNYWVRQVRFHVWPYGDTDFKDFYIPKLGSGKYQEEWPEGMDQDAKPSLVIGRGFMSWLNHASPDQYYTVKNPRFFFTIPKI